MTILGAHLDTLDPRPAVEHSLGAAQVSLGDPQSWRAPAIDYPGGAPAWRAAADGLAVFVHAPYVINLATSNHKVRIPSRQLLQQTLTAAAALGAAGVVVHGGHGLAQDDPALGVRNWRKAIDTLDLAVPLLVENTAGGARAMARTLQRLEQLWAGFAGSQGAGQVGFCLDTCHAHAAGLDLGQVVAQVRAITGRIDLVHLNDSRDAPGSGADRHANLGEGRCDPAQLVAVAAQAGAPVVLETPGGFDQRLRDLTWLRARLPSE
jgi:deoxyribonuclease-4